MSQVTTSEPSTPAATSPSASNAGPGRKPGSGPFTAVLALVATVTAVVLFLYSDGRPSGQPTGGPGTSDRAADGSDCPIPALHDPEVTRTVYAVGIGRGVDNKVMLAAFEAGWVESRMQNLDCGDRDSLGVFQQRPSQGWGTPGEVRDVRYASHAFFEAAEPMHEQYPDVTAGELAQKVQRSAFPERYDEAEEVALSMLSEARELHRSHRAEQQKRPARPAQREQADGGGNG